MAVYGQYSNNFFVFFPTFFQQNTDLYAYGFFWYVFFSRLVVFAPNMPQICHIRDAPQPSNTFRKKRA